MLFVVYPQTKFFPPESDWLAHSLGPDTKAALSVMLIIMLIILSILLNFLTQSKSRENKMAWHCWHQRKRDRLKRTFLSLGDLSIWAAKERQCIQHFYHAFPERQKFLLKIVWLISILFLNRTVIINKETTLQKSTHLPFAKNKSKGKII